MSDEFRFAIGSLAIVLTTALAAVIAVVVVWILSTRNDVFKGDIEEEDERMEMGYTGMMPTLDVMGRRYVFLATFLIAFLVLWFLCGFQALVGN
jgi:hypothetical protein